jgi:hypothetical protein
MISLFLRNGLQPFLVAFHQGHQQTNDFLNNSME